jgi:hypothetical protein
MNGPGEVRPEPPYGGFGDGPPALLDGRHVRSRGDPPDEGGGLTGLDQLADDAQHAVDGVRHRLPLVHSLVFCSLLGVVPETALTWNPDAISMVESALRSVS